jgi:hypothetical protein
VPLDPLRFETPQAYSAFDFSPLMKLGQQLQQQQDQKNLADLAARYGYGSPNVTDQPATAIATMANRGARADTGPSSYQDAISRIESGGRYDLQGPVTSGGDRAYGKYQVMGANIPQWTKDALGRSMTPAEFLASPQAQDTVFNHRFGSYVNKYGPGGAARAWFAGEGGMNNPNARDQLGTSVGSYERQFLKGLGNGD